MSPEIVPKCDEPDMAAMRRIAEILRFDRSQQPQPPPAPPPKPEKMGIIYFIGAEDGPVKIGFTTNLETRLGRLQVGSPVKLKVLAAVTGPNFDERVYHMRFRWARLHGEWFERTPELEAEIEKLSAQQA